MWQGKQNHQPKVWDKYEFYFVTVFMYHPVESIALSFASKNI